MRYLFHSMMLCISSFSKRSHKTLPISFSTFCWRRRCNCTSKSTSITVEVLFTRRRTRPICRKTRNTTGYLFRLEKTHNSRSTTSEKDLARSERWTGDISSLFENFTYQGAMGRRELPLYSPVYSRTVRNNVRFFERSSLYSLLNVK